MTTRVLGYLGLAVAALAMLVGCSAQDGGTNDEGALDGESVGKTSDALGFRAWTYDGGTQCTVGGITMHCCPGQQQGFVNYAMVGINSNNFKCARLDPTNGNAPTLSAMQRTVNGVTGLACPTGQVMVGFHQALQRAACVTVSPNPLAERATPGVWDGSVVTCNPVFPNQNSFYVGEAMTGLRTSGGLSIFCGQ